jgi:phytol kinase
MSQNLIGLIISYLYVFGMIGAGELLRKWRGYSIEFTRKFIHIAVGMWAFGTVSLFEDRAFAIIPPITFTLINAISYRYETFKAMETGEKNQLGTVYFPIAFAVAVWTLWGEPAILVAALMPLTWGDALAAVIGTRYGRRRYTVAGSMRSMEGSAAMFLASWLSAAAALILLATPQMAVPAAVGAAALAAAGATVVEAISPYGIDNLTVPAVSALLLTAVLA